MHAIIQLQSKHSLSGLYRHLKYDLGLLLFLRCMKKKKTQYQTLPHMKIDTTLQLKIHTKVPQSGLPKMRQNHDSFNPPHLSKLLIFQQYCLDFPQHRALNFQDLLLIIHRLCGSKLACSMGFAAMNSKAQCSPCTPPYVQMRFGKIFLHSWGSQQREPLCQREHLYVSCLKYFQA